MVITKGIRITCYAVIAAFILSYIALAVATGVQRKHIKECKAQLKAKTEQIDSLARYNRELGELNGLQVNVTFQFTQKNVLSFSQSNCQNVAKEVAQLTRKELLDSLKADRP